MDTANIRLSAADLVGSLRAVMPDVLVATDFDGTLAPIVVDPQQSRPVDGAIDALGALAAAGARVAVITGRDAGTVVRLGGLDRVPALTVAGLYGAETWHAGELSTLDTPEAMTALRQRLPRTLEQAGADPEIWVEDKRLSLVVHARKADEPVAALDAVRPAVERLADELDLEMHPGTGILELRLPGYDKAGALSRLVGEAGGVLFLGDDVGDLPAFAEIRRLRDAGRTAWGVSVLASGVDAVRGAADLELDRPDEVVELLRALSA